MEIMIKTKKWLFLRWTLALLMAFGALLPVSAAYAEGEPADVTGLLTGITLAVTQDDEEIGEGGSLSSTDPITVEISFRVPVEGDQEEWEDEDPFVHKGDFALFDLGDSFYLKSSGSIELKDKSNHLVGHVTFSTDDETGVVTARVDFDGEDDIFSNNSHGVTAKFKAEFEYNADGDAGSAGDHHVTILEKTYVVTVPPVEILYNVEKTGSINFADECIDWTVTLSATQGGEAYSLEGYRFFDDLTAVGDYVADSFAVDIVDNAEPEYDVENKELTYDFPEGAMSPAEITFSTALTEAQLLATSAWTITNKAELWDTEDGTEPLAGGEKGITFTPKWIEKAGAAGGEYTAGGSYSPTNRTITWTITVNHLGATLPNAVVTDELPDGLTFGSATMRAWDAENEEWGAAVPVTPDGDDYPLGDIDTMVRLTIVTKVDNDEYTADIRNFSNTAALTWTGLTGAAPSEGDTVGIGYNAIMKSGEVSAAAPRTVTWTVTVDARGQTIPDAKVYDLLVYGTGIDFDEVTGIPAGIDTDDLTPGYNQKYAYGSFSGTGLTCVVHTITRTVDGETVPVADLLEITGFPVTSKTFTFDTVIVNPNIFAGNRTSTLYNTATLFSGTTWLNDDSANVSYTNKLLAKRMLTRAAAANPAANANTFTKEPTEGFDYVDKSAVFRLDINYDGIDLPNMTNASGQLLGEVTVTDTLPAGWEFASFSGDDDAPVYYLIFLGAKNPNGTVTATGTPLDPATITGLTAYPPAPATETDGETVTFTFTALAQPYVILVKARLTDETAAAYFGENQTKTDANTVTLHTANWTTGVSDGQSVTIDSAVLTKDWTQPESGVLRWTVDYKPYDLLQPGREIKDIIPEGMELRRTSSGALILTGGYITAQEMTLGANGGYTPGDAVTLTLIEGETGNIGYDPGTRALTFRIPDSATAYQLTYLTDITGEPSPIPVYNSVSLLGGGEEQESARIPYTIKQADGEASFGRNGWIRITKTDENGVLPGAEFTLFTADGETVFKQGRTKTNGILEFKVIPDGEYILKETDPPEGYGPDRAVHTLRVSTAEDGAVTSSIDGKTGEDANTLAVENFLEGTVGDLVITKTVAGNRGDQQKLFDFTVTFFADTANGRMELEGEYFYYRGDADLPEGTVQSGGTISLAHGERVTIENLPREITYTVTEADYRGEGYRTVSEGATGVIVADEAQTAAFTNTKNRVKDDVKKPVEKGALTITKTVDGDLGDRDQLFTFVVSFDTDDTYRYSGSKTGSIKDGGTVLLKHGESVVIRGIPAGTVYKVVEKEAGQGGYGTSFTGASGKITESGRTAAFVNEKEGIPNTGDESLDNAWTVGLAGSVLILLGSVGLILSFKKKKGKDNR